MTKKTSLVIMAAGMGSRYGGAKQIDPIDEEGHIIIDYSVYDAIKAGFNRIIFVVKPEMEQDIEDIIGRNVKKFAEVCYAHQTVDVLPSGYTVPEGRIKPWGTGHAVLCAEKYIDGAFAAVNADDFYGRSAYFAAHDYITSGHGDNAHCMVGYRLRNTVTENGYVSRGICAVDEDCFLTDITERLHIEKRGDDAAYTEDGKNYIHIDGGTYVSMNMWGFGHSMINDIRENFTAFLEKAFVQDPLKSEYFLPDVAKTVIKTRKGSVKLLPSEDKWFGVTYREDKAAVSKAIEQLKAEGAYPRYLWR